MEGRNGGDIVSTYIPRVFLYRCRRVCGVRCRWVLRGRLGVSGLCMCLCPGGMERVMGSRSEALISYSPLNLRDTETKRRDKTA